MNQIAPKTIISNQHIALNKTVASLEIKVEKIVKKNDKAKGFNASTKKPCLNPCIGDIGFCRTYKR